MRPRRAPALLEDIREAAQYITDETAGESLASFSEERRLLQTVERNFEIIGEAMRRLRQEDPSIAARFTDVREIVDFRNFLVHAYELVRPERVWRTVQYSLPILLEEVNRELRRLDPE